MSGSRRGPDTTADVVLPGSRLVRGSHWSGRMRQVLRSARVALDVAAAALDRDRPLITHLIVTRRCNLSCTYCFEYDKVSAPVPLDVLKERIDHLARLRSVFVTLTGGESLLHPQIVDLVRHVRARGMTPFLNTNGFLLTKDLVLALNAAGLYGMQLSIDNARPNAVSRKSLKTLAPKLQLLKQHAEFHVRINTVIGSSPPAEALGHRAGLRQQHLAGPAGEWRARAAVGRDPRRVPADSRARPRPPAVVHG
jgi:hypothetical protein